MWTDNEWIPDSDLPTGDYYPVIIKNSEKLLDYFGDYPVSLVELDNVIPRLELDPTSTTSLIKLMGESISENNKQLNQNTGNIDYNLYLNEEQTGTCSYYSESSFECLIENPELEFGENNITYEMTWTGENEGAVWLGR